MKKVLCALIALAMLLSFAACGKSTGDTGSSVENEPASSVTESVVSEQSSAGNQNPPAAGTESSTKTPSKTETSPTHKHNYKAVKTPATCTQQGYTTYTCSCGSSYKGDYVTGAHQYENNRCKFCGKADMDNLYAFLRDWLIKNGTANGEYIAYSQLSDVYGGSPDETFEMFYWEDNKKLYFCLYSPMDNDYSYNFTVYIPQQSTGKYSFDGNYFHRNTNESMCYAEGVIEAKAFTNNYPLKCDTFEGPSDLRTRFTEQCRLGICDTLDCLKSFLEKEKLGYTLSDLGFTAF